MEFHGTVLVSDIGTLQVPWNSMELLVSTKLAHFKFYGIPWSCSCQRNWLTVNSMEFHGTACVCLRNWRILSSMEFRGIDRVSEIGALQVPWNSMEFHGTARVSLIGALQVTWNSMEFDGTARVSVIGAF